MSNDYFDFLTPLVEHTLAKGEDINALFRAVQQGFEKIPAAAQLAGGTAGYGTTTGSSSAYTLLLDPVLPALVAGVRVRMKMHATSTATPRSSSKVRRASAKQVQGRSASSPTRGTVPSSPRRAPAPSSSALTSKNRGPSCRSCVAPIRAARSRPW